MKSNCALAFAMICVAVQADTNQFAMPLRGVTLPATDFKLVNHIPRERLARLPRELPVYRYTGRACEFPVAALQVLLDQSPFAGTNITDLLPSGTNQTTATHGIRLVSQDRLDYFIVSPGEGRIMMNRSERGRGIPPPDAVPDFEIIQERLLRLARTFGISTNEMERQPDGVLFIRKREGGGAKLGGVIQYKSSREVEIRRAIPDYPFNSVGDDKISLRYGVNDRLQKFELTWQGIEPVRTNRLLGISEIMDGIKKGRVLSDVMNEYPAGGIAEVELRDIEIEYYVPFSPSSASALPTADIYPIASILAVFKSKTGETEEAGLYAPILDRR
jgi:hypothetical protein